jgi:mannosyltransferase OCH1-like enzyme
MIPKIIHYCWFGKQRKSALILSCIQSWKIFLSDYEIIEWHEGNTDLTHHFVSEAYKLKKWAFVSDFIRLDVLHRFGGIYLDTDMMLLKSLNELLINKCFFGSEEYNLISAGIIGCEKNDTFIKLCLENYSEIKLNNSTNFYDLAIPILITRTYNKEYVETSFDSIKKTEDGLTIYPMNYFYPFPNHKKKDILNFKAYAQKETFAIHLWNASWVEYDEFHYLRNRKYSKSFLMILKKIFIDWDLNLYYFKRIYNNLRNSFR